MSERDDGPGQRDWDFVSMSDYQSDMKESADSAAGIIKVLKNEADFWRALVEELVASAGGRAKVSRRPFINAGTSVMLGALTIEYCASSNSYQLCTAVDT